MVTYGPTFCVYLHSFQARHSREDVFAVVCFDSAAVSRFLLFVHYCTYVINPETHEECVGCGPHLKEDQNNQNQKTGLLHKMENKVFVPRKKMDELLLRICCLFLLQFYHKKQAGCKQLWLFDDILLHSLYAVAGRCIVIFCISLGSFLKTFFLIDLAA